MKFRNKKNNSNNFKIGDVIRIRFCDSHGTFNGKIKITQNISGGSYDYLGEILSVSPPTFVYYSVGRTVAFTKAEICS